MIFGSGILAGVHIVLLIGVFARGAEGAAALPGLLNSMFFRADLEFSGQELGQNIMILSSKTYGEF